MLQISDSVEVTDPTGGYTAPVAETALGRRIRQLRGTRTLKEVNKAARIGVSKLSKLERGEEDNPTLDTIQSVARGLNVSLATLFEDNARPGGETGHDAAGTISSTGDSEGLAGYFTQLAALGDEQFPAPDTWQGDVHQAIAALNRALRRQTVTSDAGAKARTPRS